MDNPHINVTLDDDIDEKVSMQKGFAMLVSHVGRKRTSLGIFGKTGSGKSSVANLICRLYDSSSGDIFINNINIMNIKLSSLRQSIGYVPQDNYLFST